MKNTNDLISTIAALDNGSCLALTVLALSEDETRCLLAARLLSAASADDLHAAEKALEHIAANDTNNRTLTALSLIRYSMA